MTAGKEGVPGGTGFAAPRMRWVGWAGIAVAVILIVWLLALLTSMTLGGWAHLLPFAALGVAIRAAVVAFRRRHLTETSRKH
ncbi:MAG: hypothetical protein ABR517_08425 [Thermoanaerobaculia bacterium]